MLNRNILHKENIAEHVERRWKSYDGVDLYAQTWQPGVRPKAYINLIHGLGEHSGRYHAWAGRFADKGIAVRSFDMRGYGRSGGRRGYASGYYKLLKDIEAFIEMGKQEFPELPVFNYGHSMGANLLLNYSFQVASQGAGLVITSPWLELTRPPSRVLLILAGILGSLIPGLVTGNRLRTEDISRDLRVVHSYRNDPLIHDRIGVKLFTQAFEAGIRASMSIYKINVPLLVMQGSEDNIVSCKAARNFVRNASNKTTYIEWEGGFHELHNDIEADMVFSTILSWMNSQLK
jgi:alpha-beta hydrolase superfamily lysophospholipase